MSFWLWFKKLEKVKKEIFHKIKKEIKYVTTKYVYRKWNLNVKLNTVE